MKKLIILLFAVMLCTTGCTQAQTPSTTAPETTSPPTTEAPTAPTVSATLEELIDQIYEEHTLELPVISVPVDLTDEYAVKSYLGLDSSAGIEEAVASESAFGSQAYSLVLCRAADPKATAQAMFEGIDRRKWICVEADDLTVTVHGDLIALVMISSEYADSATSTQLTQALSTVLGTAPDLTLHD